MSLQTLLIEPLKSFSDECIGWLLRAGSRFGSDLGQEGRAEQALWRERRLRDLRGLSLRASGRRRAKDSAK